MYTTGIFFVDIYYLLLYLVHFSSCQSCPRTDDHIGSQLQVTDWLLLQSASLHPLLNIFCFFLPSLFVHHVGRSADLILPSSCTPMGMNNFFYSILFCSFFYFSIFTTFHSLFYSYFCFLYILHGQLTCYLPTHCWPADLGTRR